MLINTWDIRKSDVILKGMLTVYYCNVCLLRFRVTLYEIFQIIHKSP